MKFNNVISEKRIPITSKSKIATRLREYRGINLIVLGENEPPDVHGIPSELEAYGRGGFYADRDGSSKLWIDGGPRGSSEGHPKFIKDGFYWGADYDVSWTSNDGQKRKGIIYVRGRAGTNEDLLEQNVVLILEQIFVKLPPNRNIKLSKQ